MYCIYIEYFNSIYVQVKELTLSCKFRLAPASTSRLTTAALPKPLAIQIGVYPYYKNRVRQIQLDYNTFIGKICFHIHIIYTYHIHTLVCVHIHCIHIHIYLYIQLQLQQIRCKLTLLTTTTHALTHTHTYSLFFSSLLSYY